MINRVVLIGRLTKDPELRYTQSGIAVTQFTLALDRPVGQGKPKEADFIPIITWRGLAESCANYLRKGRLCAVEGRIQTRNYNNTEGRKIFVAEIIADNVRFLESASKDNSGSPSKNEESTYTRSNSNNQDPFIDDGQPIDISDDDLPFK